MKLPTSTTRTPLSAAGDIAATLSRILARRATPSLGSWIKVTAMLRREFGHTGLRVPVIGQGTWNLEQVEKKRAIAALRAGLDAGMSHIDTAEMYGSGVVEEWVGEAISGRRDEVFLVSK